MHDELEAQIRARPDDLETLLVYADWLQSQGDPHGELIVIQHELATRPSPSLKRQQSAWFASHRTFPKKYDATWRLGFVRTLALRTKTEIDPKIVELVGGPACRFLESLTLVGSISTELVGEIVAAVPHLRELALHSQHTLEGAAITSVVRQLRELRRLAVFSAGFDEVPAIASRSLEALALGQYFATAKPINLKATLPALRSLILDTPLAPRTIDAVLAKRWPVTTLGLFVADEPELRERVRVATRAWTELEEIGVDWSDVVDEPVDFGPIAKRFGARRIIPSPFWNGRELYRLGQALRDQDRFAEALRCFELGIVVDPKDPSMWLEHGNLLTNVGRQAEGIGSYERACKIDPAHWRAQYNIAAHHRDTNDPGPGLPRIVKACEHAGSDPSPWHLRGQLERMLGKRATESLQKARRFYQRAFDSDPKDADSLFQIACVHQLLGKRRACLETLAKAIAIDPECKARALDDIDLISLREDPELLRLVADAPKLKPGSSTYSRS